MSRFAIALVLTLVFCGSLSAQAGDKRHDEKIAKKIRIALVFDLSGSREPAFSEITQAWRLS